ncbi:hypothetical protein M8C21_026264 [Ambrosia artemisiifolia]|uniref:Rubber elongation factor n=1 Tax=Ambrosia artemisiifolia TaxID=4212 RepID=A0AAD5GSR6_AMBAR|nr:hypothetical protein M8C21_026264 [Ambrosia artemisiifolia]
MSSNEIESEQSTTELKYLWLLKKIAVRFVVVMSNVYEFAKENSGDFKTKVVLVENIIVSIFGPVYEKLKNLPEQTLEFVDNQFDKDAPSQTKKVVIDFQSLLYETKPLVKKLVTTAQAVTVPLISFTIFLLKITRYLIQSITPLKRGITTTQTQSPLLVGTTQSLVQNTLDATKSLVPDTIIPKGPDLVNQAADATKSLVGGLPLVGNVAQSLTTNPTDLANQAQNTTKSLFGGLPVFGNVAQSLTTNPADLANQIANTTNSLVKENPILEAVNSAAQNSLEATSSLVGGIPIVGDVAESLTNPADLANQVLNTTNSLVNENPLLGAINSATENLGNNSAATGAKAALQSAYMTLKLSTIPIIAQLWYELMNKYPIVAEISEFVLPVVECVSVLYNNLVTLMDTKGYSIAGYLPLVPIDEMKAAYKLVKTSRDGLAAVGDLIGVDSNKGLSAVGDLLGVNKNK